MRLIDVDALKEELGDTRDGKPVFRHTEFIRMDVLEEAIDKTPTIKTFTLADIEKQYQKGLEKGLEEAETKKCPIFSDDEVKQPCIKSPCGFERQHGEWIDLSDGWQEGTYECSNCKTEFVLIEGTPEDNEYNFCPNCGAKMQKEGEAD